MIILARRRATSLSSFAVITIYRRRLFVAACHIIRPSLTPLSHHVAGGRVVSTSGNRYAYNGTCTW